MAAAGTAVLILLTGYCWGRNHFVVHQQTFVFDNLPPAFDGYRIAFFSDIHIGTFRQGNEKDVQTIADLINEQKADAIMFGGDLVNYQCAEVYGFEQQMSSLKAKDGVFSIMGNHDYSSYIRYASEEEKQADIDKLHAKQREFGWTLLLNEHRIIRRGNDSIAVIGLCFGRVIEGSLAAEIGKWVLMGLVVIGILEGFVYFLGPLIWHFTYGKRK